MNLLWPRFLKSAYRKEPISSFILVVGSVDAVIGGIDNHWSLLLFGLGTIGVAIALRFWKSQQSQIEVPVRAPIHSLPERSSRPPMPMLSSSRRNGPRG